jgi:hypothetical protein
MSNKTLIHTDLSQLALLARAFGKSAKAVQAASAAALNRLAFCARQEMIKTLKSTMTIRNEKFLSQRIKYQPTSYRLPVSSQEAQAGSVALPRFSGWVEQETGEQSDKTRIGTLLARGGVKTAQIKHGARLKRSNMFPTPRWYPGKNPHQQAVVMMDVLQRNNYKRPFKVFGHTKLKSGLYMFVDGKPRMLQDFRPRAASLKPKMNEWCRASAYKCVQDSQYKKVFRALLTKGLRLK